MSPDFNHIIDDLLVKYLLGEANGQERALVEEWMAADAANKKQFEDLKTIWEESKKLAVGSAVDADAAWGRFKNRVQNGEEKVAVVRQMRPVAWFKIAALFILVIGVGIFGYQMFSDGKVEQLAVVSKASTVIDTLPDGSVVTLNKNSSLAYPSKFKGGTRTIALKGEAFFNITPDKKKPFIINVNDVQVKVVGTSFNIRSGNGMTEVIVETGVVQVTRNNKTVELRPAEKLKLGGQDMVLAKEKVEDKLYNYYRSKEFVCEETPVWKLVEVLNEAYDANIIIENPKIRSERLTTTFNSDSLEHILEILHLTFNITVLDEGNRIILK